MVMSSLTPSMMHEPSLSRLCPRASRTRAFPASSAWSNQLAEVYGAKGFYVEHPGEVADAVQQALALDGPSVIEIPVAEYFPPAAPLPGA